MFPMIFGSIIGIVLGVLVLLIFQRKPGFLGWTVFGLGALGCISILPALSEVINITIFTGWLFMPGISVVAGAACIISGIGAIAAKRSLGWQVWLGLGLGAIPLLFWLAFGAASLF